MASPCYVSVEDGFVLWYGTSRHLRAWLQHRALWLPRPQDKTTQTVLGLFDKQYEVGPREYLSEVLEYRIQVMLFKYKPLKLDLLLVRTGEESSKELRDVAIVMTTEPFSVVVTMMILMMNDVSTCDIIQVCVRSFSLSEIYT